MATLPQKWLFFDMDGTMIDTLPPLYNAYSLVKEKLGQTPDRGEFAQLQGASMREIAIALARSGDSLSGIEQDLEEAHARFIPQHSRLFPGVESFLTKCKNRGFSLWVVTSARRETADRLLGQARVIDYFDGIITSDTLKACKPDPEIYLKTMQASGAIIDQITVFEDSPQGIAAALAANLNVVAHTAEESILMHFRHNPKLLAHFDDWPLLSDWFFKNRDIHAH